MIYLKSSKHFHEQAFPTTDIDSIFNWFAHSRFSRDLQHIFEENGKQFDHKSVLQIAVRVITVLEYMHDHDYVHADIKAGNLLLGYQKGTENQVFTAG